MSSDRFPPLKREQVPEKDLELYDSVMNMGEMAFGKSGNEPFVWKRKDDALVGPFPALLSHPPSAKSLLEANAHIAQIPGLPKDAREVAIIATGARFQAAFELYAHSSIAVKVLGMDRAQIDAIAHGEKPEDLSEPCEIAYDVATYLVTRPGPLPKELWDRSQKVLGKDGTLALIHFVAFYAHTCVMLNAMDAPVPNPDD